MNLEKLSRVHAAFSKKSRPVLLGLGLTRHQVQKGALASFAYASKAGREAR
jgi:hypothetical protein